MGRQVRDSDAIAQAGQQLKKASNDLVTVKNNFLKHLDSMLNNYKGSKATRYGEMLKMSINKVDDIVKAFDYFSKYMINLSNYDNQNVQKTISRLKESHLESRVVVDESDKYIC